ncbi:hypothetical protein VCHA54P500_20184 [Vibrio chagasii]|nr:hypothetical protein VCHA34P117_20145 [Vibrio chagasii]CAH6935711.1 hypothetical protein VCHA30O60_40197 [Vibrio chagasii]CAH7063768.1 hypothetical protein VCHA34P121_70207 [Vibrio chagasii]CAH7132918.1 hypothetical protein VCHA48P439_20145 [Vibrio chagasii]CAH7146963.1 hypothetical protein VCHA40O236_20145 [Vibrio chagasii]
MKELAKAKPDIDALLPWNYSPWLYGPDTAFIRIHPLLNGCSYSATYS